jgi:hypothetical protein
MFVVVVVLGTNSINKHEESIILGKPAVRESIALGIYAPVSSKYAIGRYITRLIVPLTHDVFWV